MLTDEGVELTFMELPGDVRTDGALVQTRSIAVRDNSPYADEILAIRDAVTGLVEDIVEDWPSAPVYEHEDDDDDAEGMGSG